MRNSLPVTHARRRRHLFSSVALGTTVLALATGCTQPASAPVDEHTFGMHQVISISRAGMSVTHVTHRQMLESYGWELTDSALAAMEWVLAADCNEPAPATEQFVVACDSESFAIYLMHPAALTAQDIADAEVITSDSGIDQGTNEGYLALTFTDEATQVFSTLTGGLAFAIAPANQVAIVVDGVVISAPQVTEQITGGSAMVATSEPDPQLNDLAAWLNAQGNS